MLSLVRANRYIVSYAVVLLLPRLSVAQTSTMPDDASLFDETGVYETVVTAVRPALAAGTTVVDRETIAQSRPTSADEILTLVPGLKIVQHGAEGKGHQIFLRGFDAAHGSDVEGIVSEVRLNEPSHVHGQGYLDLYGIIPEVVSRITVAGGPFLPWQGDFAVAGSVRFELAASDEIPTAFLKTEATHRGAFRQVAVATPRDGDKETFAAVEFGHDAGFGPDRISRRGVLMAQHRLDVGNAGALTSLLSLQSARFESPETLRWSDVKQGEKEFLDTYGPAGEGCSDRLMLRTAWERDRGRSELEVALFGGIRHFRLEENFTGRLLYPAHGDLRSQVQDGGAVGVDSELKYRFSTRLPLQLTAGLGWRLDGYGQQDRQLDENGAPWQTNRDIRGVQQGLYVYVGLRFSPTDTLTLYPSIRGAAALFHVKDTSTGNTVNDIEAVPLPRVIARFDPHPRVTLFASYGRGYRSPEARAHLAVPISEIEDERLSSYAGGAAEITVADSFEVGIETTPHDVITASLTGFATLLTSEMVFDHVSNLNVAMDGTRRFGVTLESVFQPNSWVSVSGDVTYTDARFNRSRNRVPGVPIWMGQARAALGRPRGLNGGAALTAVGRRPLAHGASVGGYVDLGLNVGWRFERIDIDAVVDNVLNREIMEGAYHFASWFDDTEPRSALPSVHFAAGAPLTARFLIAVYL